MATRISGHYTVSAAPAQAPAPVAKASGSWRGHSITLVNTQDPAVFHMRATQAQALPMIAMRDVGSRRVSVETNFRRMAPTDILQRAQTMGIDLRGVRASARAVLMGRSGAPAAAGAGRMGSISRYLALQLAAASVEDDISEAAATALLTPVRTPKHSPQDLSELLRHAANDSEEFEHFLQDILAGLDTTPQDAEELATKLRLARNDDEKLMELLRKAQKIPQLHEEQDPRNQQIRLQLRQQIHDEIREFERSNEGPLVLANFNAAPAAAGTSDPISFLQTYTDLVSVPHTFAGALKMLLTRYPVDVLAGILDNLKKALGDDLGAATPSHDTRRLGAILADLGHMTISTSLLESVRELIELMRRRQQKRREDERGRGKRGGQEPGEEEDEKQDPRKAKGHGRGR